MTVLVGLAKYKEKNNILATIISSLLFFATIIGIQVKDIYSTVSCKTTGLESMIQIVRLYHLIVTPPDVSLSGCIGKPCGRSTTYDKINYYPHF